MFWLRPADLSSSFSSSVSSAETAEKLLTKFSGFLISWAMPAVSWPSEASFSVCTSRFCAALSSSNDFASSWVRASTLSNRRTFSMGDGRLVREGRHKFNLLFGKWTSFRARENNDADRHALAHHGHPQDGAEIADPLAFGEGVVRVGGYVGNVDDGSFKQRAPRRGAAVGRYRNRFDQIHELIGKPETLGAIEFFASLACNGALLGVTQPGCRFDQRMQHRLQVERRAADHLQDVGGGGLLLKGFGEIVGALPQFVYEPHGLNRNDSLALKSRDKVELAVTQPLDVCPDHVNASEQL